MNKFLSLLCALCCIGSIFAREPQRGYRGFVEWSNDVTSFKIDEHTSQSFYYTGVSTSHGFQFNPHLFVGGGITLERYVDYDTWFTPIFAQVRTDQKWGKFTPFGDLRVGYNSADGAGYFLSPTIGYRFNWGRKVNINAGLGLTLRGYSVEQYDFDIDIVNGYFDMTYLGTKHSTKAMFSFRLGIDF